MSDIETHDTSRITTSSIDTYLAAYGEPDDVRRREQIAAAFHEDATLADPPFDAGGHDALDAAFVAVQSQFPGHRFRRVSGIDQHHGAARFEWEFVAENGTPSVVGTDFVRFADDGRIAAVVGFFGPLPAVTPSSPPGADGHAG
jgi:hypothetical protein